MLFKCIFEKIDKTYRKMFYNGRIRWKKPSVRKESKENIFCLLEKMERIIFLIKFEMFLNSIWIKRKKLQ